ncbi:MinD-like ATPase involved in chromosome partitioning or flagellar assembly [Antricoccus suffuscus]|uniref:MinD-like ATPase involved in chromosome partitioning or flagellar assembly n=2 Tax=Antricoccus suffuscus TaxID=1629062 RepID=A0A2T0ZZV7_9ACTN|nr:MinD-like ATPase involved in chromosome partitioning or flagellar assembly [Antricoccus suffuscus]
MPANPVSNGLELPIHTPRRISVVGMKGGVGKTTMAIMLATAAARARREQVLLLDADTTYGSLMLRMGIAPVASSHDIAQMGDPGSLDVLAGAISRNNDGVWVLPTGRTPAQSAAFGEATYVQAMRAVYRHFPITVSDCGAGMAGTLMQRVISASHSLVIATAPSMDSVLASHNALQWLDSIGYEALARRSIVAIGNVDINNPRIDLAEARQRFAPLCRAVVTIPSDPHLAPGSHLRYDALAAPTVRAAHDLAANVLEAALSVP